MNDHEIEDLLDALFRQAQIQLGTAVRGRWMHDGDDCPGCGKEITATRYMKKDALSLNAYIYREHNVLIAYMLCGKCATHIITQSEIAPFRKLPIHDTIEKNLKAAFLRHTGH